MAGQDSTEPPNARRWLLFVVAAAIALLVIVLVLLLSQCGDDDEPQVAEMEPAATGPPGETPADVEGSGPVAQWLFDGDATDATGNGHDATELGGVEYTGGSATMDGMDDAFRVANAPDLNPADAITVSAWWNSADFVGAGNNGLVDKGFTSHDAPHYQYHLGITGPGWPGGPSFGFQVTVDGAEASTGYQGWTVGETYHLVGTYDGAEVRLYVNGALESARAASGSMEDYGQDLYIGRFTNLDQEGTHFLPGGIGEVTIWGRALSEEEVAALYAAGAQ